MEGTLHPEGEKSSSQEKPFQGNDSTVNASAQNADNQDKREVLLSMRQKIEERGSSVKGVDDATLLRFLRARSMSVDKAAKMFIQQQEWRASYIPLGYIPDQEVPNELESKKVFLQGTSKRGWPILVGIARNHNAEKRNLEELKRFMAYVLDKVIASASPGVEKMLVIMDLQKIAYKNVDVRAAIAGFSMLQAYYPERLGRLYMVNVPHMFMKFWKMIRRFIDKETEKKIVFVEEKETKKMLLQDIELSYIPKIYGGQAELVLIQDVKLANWPQSAE